MTSLEIELPDLPECLTRLLGQVPTGRVTTYGTLAEALGSEAAARWVGHWMMHHEHRSGCRCHRVVRADGALGQYIDGTTAEKAARLRAEGLELVGERVADMPEAAYRQFETARPLAELQARQVELRQRVRLRGRRTLPETVAGVDVSYSGDVGTGAYVLWDRKREELAWSTTVRLPVRFPYITGLLAYRELPILLELMNAVREADRQAEVVIVDGSGILHPRDTGIACHLGVLAATPTIGVSKKLLCGQVDLSEMAPGESRPVVMDGRRQGIALRATAGSRRPIFISPGHRIGVDMAERIVRSQILDHRLPEVQFRADRLSRRAARGQLP